MKLLLPFFLGCAYVAAQTELEFNNDVLQVVGDSNSDNSITSDSDNSNRKGKGKWAAKRQAAKAAAVASGKKTTSSGKSAAKTSGAKQKWGKKAAKNGKMERSSSAKSQKQKWTQGLGKKKDQDGDMNLSGGLVLEARRSGKAQGRNVVDSVQGVRFIQQGENHIGIKWSDNKAFSDFKVDIKPDEEGITKNVVDGRRNTVMYEGLLPATVYWVTIKGVQASGAETRAVTIKVFTSPAAPINVRMASFDESGSTIKWDNLNQHSKNCYAVARLARAPKKIRTQKVNQADASITTKGMPPGVSYDILVFYVYNKRRSDTYAYRVTIKPEAVKETAVDRIELVDDGLANVQLSWAWPETWWGSVKIEYSPPTPGAKDSPLYISNRRIPVRMGKKVNRRLPNNSTVIEKLRQGIVYTFGVSLTKGPLESETVIITQGIPSTDEFRNVLEPTTLTCRVPLELNPVELRVKKNIIGEPSLVMEWNHPKSKNPEEGYKVVVVPFAESTQHLPKIYYVPADAEQNSLILTGNDFDPFIEYSVSVVAKHNPESYDHENPNGPEFTARVFTGQYVKVGGNREVDYVMPDSCCKNTLYNSNEKKCCGGTLHDIISEYECCGWAVYDKNLYMCCKSQTDEPVVNTIAEGCGFGKRVVGSSKKAAFGAKRNKGAKRKTTKKQKKALAGKQ